MTAGSIEGPAAGYSLQDAAAVLGVSVNTLRKRISSGQVKAERVQRPQGYVWQVYLDTLQPPAQSADDPPIQEAPSRLQQPPQALMQAEAMAAYTRSLMEPLVQLVEQQEATIRDQAETIGELRAENRALVARTASQTAEPSLELLPPRWRVWVPWVPALVMTVLAAVLAVLLAVLLVVG